MLFDYNGTKFSGKGTKNDPYRWTDKDTRKLCFDNRTKWIGVKNDIVTVDGVIRCLFMGLPYDKLPPNVKVAVDTEMLRRHGTSGQKEDAIKRYYATLRSNEEQQ